MSNIPITSLPVATSLDGTESVPLVQGGTTKRAAVSLISTFPSATGTFITATLNSFLPQSRVLAPQSGVTTVTDGGALGNMTVGIAANGIGNTQLRQGAARSVIGNAGNATANVDDIAGAAAQVLRVNNAGTSLGFGSLDLGQSATVGTSILLPANGGTGINNGSSTLTLGGSLATVGAFSSTFNIVGATNVTFPTSGTLATTSGASIPGVVQGDLLYGSATNVLSTLPKDTTASRYLSNSGANNNPAWATIAGGDITGAALTKTDDTNVTLTLGGTPTTALLRAASLTLGWTGQLAVSRGGTGIASGTSGGVPYFSSSSTIASSALLPQNAVLIGGGAGAAPTYVANGVNGQLLLGVTSAPPAFATMSGDATISNAGVLTLASTITAGSVGSSTAIPVLTYDAKGRLTAATTAAVIAPAGTLTGTTLAANVVNSSLTSVGTLTGGATGAGFTVNFGTSTLSGTVPLANGGTAANLTASNGGIFYSTASAGAILAGTATARLPLLSGANTAPVWGAYTLPASVTSGGIPYFSSSSTEASSGVLTANALVIGGGAGAAPTVTNVGTNGQLLLGSTGVAPSFSTMSGDATITNAGVITVANNAISNAKLATAGAATLKGNPTASTANVQDFTIQGLTARGAPDATNDRMLLWDAASGTLKYVSPGQVAAAATAGVSTFNGRTGAVVPVQGDYPTSLIPGTTTNNNATAGNIGEYTSATQPVGTPVSLSNGVANNVISVSLTAGDWDCSGSVYTLIGGATTVTYFEVGISTASATLPARGTNGSGAVLNIAAVNANLGLSVPATRISIASTTTVYLVTSSLFTGGTNSAYGFISCRRAR